MGKLGRLDCFWIHDGRISTDASFPWYCTSRNPYFASISRRRFRRSYFHWILCAGHGSLDKSAITVSYCTVNSAADGKHDGGHFPGYFLPAL